MISVSNMAGMTHAKVKIRGTGWRDETCSAEKLTGVPVTARPAVRDTPLTNSNFAIILMSMAAYQAI